jgi:hypothetical protein
MANMTKNLHMNTPEQTMNGVDIDDNDDDVDNGQTNKQQLIEQLQAQLIHNQLRRTQARDYARILHHSNTPAYWYKAPPISRSVYFYDPNYQKQVQQQLTVSQRTKPHKRVSNKEHFHFLYCIRSSHVVYSCSIISNSRTFDESRKFKST